jgi:hypothetical protein
MIIDENVKGKLKCLFFLSEDFIDLLFSICGEFEAIKQRALTKPATTAELNDIIKYIDNAKGEKSIQLTQRIKVCCDEIIN